MPQVRGGEPAGLLCTLYSLCCVGWLEGRLLLSAAPSLCPPHCLSSWLSVPGILPPPPLPLAPPPAGATAHDTQRPWLSDVLTALLQRAAELDLLPATVPPEEAAAAAAIWRQQLPRLYALVERHVSALHEAFQAGMAMGEKEAAAEVKALMPISLVRVLLPHCSKEQAGVLRSALRDLGV